MTSAYQTSDRLCRAISKNFLADFELEEKLASIEKNRRKTGLQMYKNRLDIKHHLRASPRSPESFRAKRTGKEFRQEHSRRNEVDVFVLSGCTTPAERKRRNIRSYQRLVRRLQQSCNTHGSSSTHGSLQEDSKEQIERSDHTSSPSSLPKCNPKSSLPLNTSANNHENPAFTGQSKSDQANRLVVSEVRLPVSSCLGEQKKKREFPSLRTCLPTIRDHNIEIITHKL